ncbi:MAG: NUDIX domain-containing protein [Patescibacteria group bacterium]
MEYLNFVDDSDNVLGIASFDDVYSKALPHRIVHVLLFNNEGEMAIQLRSEKKTFCPRHWSTAVGGHVQAGESYEDAAQREYQEELGVVSDLQFLDKFIYSDARMKKFLGIFKAIYPGPFQINPEEVDRVEYFKIDEIKRMIKKGEKFHPELIFLLQKLF